MQKTVLTTLIIGLALTGSAAFAAGDEEISAQPSAQSAIQPELQWKKQFQSLDKNKDGVIDSKEAKADKVLDKQFKSIAKQGKLDETGYMNWQQVQQPRS